MRTRTFLAGLALLTTGTVVGATTQHFVAADVSSGDRPVLIPIEPCRLADTRPAPTTVGPRSVPLGPADTHTIDAQQTGVPCTGEIPTDAIALSLNVTALGATTLSFLTIWAGGDLPLAASLNPAPGQPPVPNAVTVDLSVDQDFQIYNDIGSVDVVVDVNGYYVNHDHDDRYYTKAEIDSRKYIDLPTMRDLFGFTADPARGGSVVYATSFVVPPDYTPGTTMTLRLNLLKLDFNPLASCVVDLSPNALYLLRPSTGETVNDDGGSVTDGLSGAGVANFDAVGQQLRTIEFTISAPGTIPIEPGDSATVALFTSTFTCEADEVGVHSAAIYYD